MFKANKICKLFNIKYPILQGGMAWASNGKLASSVSNAGGLGIIGCAGREAEWVLNEIKYAKNNTSNQIGLNVALNDENAVNIIEIAVMINTSLSIVLNPIITDVERFTSFKFCINSDGLL